MLYCMCFSSEHVNKMNCFYKWAQYRLGEIGDE